LVAKTLVLKANWADKDVQVLCDQDKEGIDRAVSIFVDRFNAADNPTALFYFAGHGAQVNNENYIFGVGAKVDVKRSAAILAKNARNNPFPVDALDVGNVLTLDIGDVTTGALLIILDACRDNPMLKALRGMRGYGFTAPKPLKVPHGILTAFSASDGDTADDGQGDSPYAVAFTSYIAAAKEIEAALDDTDTKVYNDSAEMQQPTKFGGFAKSPVCFTSCAGATAELRKWVQRVAFVSAAPPPSSVMAQASVAQRSNSDTGSSTVRTVYQAPPSVAMPNGKDAQRIDVFWCSGDGLDQSRQILASEVAASISTFARTNPNLGRSLVSVRTKPLPPEANQTGPYEVGSNTIAFDPNDPKQLTWARTIQQASLIQFSLRATPTSLPGYTRVFVCANANINLRRPTIYFQISRPGQQDRAREAVVAIEQDVRGLSISSDLDLEPDKSPDSSDVRYYFESDKTAATEIAKALESSTGKAVNVKYFAKLAYRSQPGTIEVWLGKDVPDTRSGMDSGGDMSNNGTPAVVTFFSNGDLHYKASSACAGLLSRLGFRASVEKTIHRGTSNQVRYFYDGDKLLGTQLQRALKDNCNMGNFDLVSDPDDSNGTPRGSLEVWFGPAAGG
jgi:hypothetical protein